MLGSICRHNSLTVNFHHYCLGYCFTVMFVLHSSLPSSLVIIVTVSLIDVYGAPSFKVVFVLYAYGQFHSFSLYFFCKMLRLSALKKSIRLTYLLRTAVAYTALCNSVARKK